MSMESRPGNLVSGAGQVKNNSAPASSEADVELLAKFAELTKYYSVEAVIDMMAVESLGYDPEKYDIQPSDGYPWNGYLVDRETGFAEFQAGLYWRHIKAKAEIANRLYHELYRLSQLKVNKTMIDAAFELQHIEKLWKEVMAGEKDE